MTRTTHVVLLLLVLVTTSGCATYEAQRKPGLEAEPNPARVRTDVEPRNKAVQAIVETARDQFHDGRLDASEETINRGLNIAPENPILWHLLAKIRFLEDNYEQAETLARRSISYTSDNRDLTSQNWRLIGYARKELGRPESARKALDRIEKPREDDGWFWW